MQTTEYLHLGHDNTIDIILTEDGVALTTAEIAAVTRVTLDFGNSIIMDSDTLGSGDGQPFDWTEGNGKLIMDLGDQSTIPEGVQSAELVVYSPDNPDGIVWGDIDIIVNS